MDMRTQHLVLGLTTLSATRYSLYYTQKNCALIIVRQTVCVQKCGHTAWIKFFIYETLIPIQELDPAGQTVLGDDTLTSL
ncbi:unnamed protein product [Allacma fusca]|uniref:Uncharacterized protein n=1 Tax=Allacma fusca TaxID=39272 RepID=A0A8J2KFM4_9HEXA|nr:unnamed protein product [Allacma fusca]